MERQFRDKIKTFRLTESEQEEFTSLVGYRKLWTWSELVVAGLELLSQQRQRERAADQAAAAELPTSKRKAVKKR